MRVCCSSSCRKVSLPRLRGYAALYTTTTMISEFVCMVFWHIALSSAEDLCCVNLMCEEMGLLPMITCVESPCAHMRAE